MVPVLSERARAVHRHSIALVDVALDELVTVSGMIHKARVFVVVQHLGTGTHICREKPAYCIRSEVLVLFFFFPRRPWILE